MDCPQCAESTEQLHEGYCEECCSLNQEELDQYNYEYYRWQLMDEESRDEAILRGYV